MMPCLQDGVTLLLAASEDGHDEVVSQLLKVPGIDVNVAHKVIVFPGTPSPGPRDVVGTKYAVHHALTLTSLLVLV
jgi:hypothetical protein